MSSLRCKKGIHFFRFMHVKGVQFGQNVVSEKVRVEFLEGVGGGGSLRGVSFVLFGFREQ